MGRRTAWPRAPGEAGLTVDAMADELAIELDRADAAAISGDADDLANALAIPGMDRRTRTSAEPRRAAAWEAICVQFEEDIGGPVDLVFESFER